MADERNQREKLARFDFPAGASAEQIAKALNEAREKMKAEKAAKQQPKKD